MKPYQRNPPATQHKQPFAWYIWTALLQGTTSWPSNQNEPVNFSLLGAIIHSRTHIVETKQQQRICCGHICRRHICRGHTCRGHVSGITCSIAHRTVSYSCTKKRKRNNFESHCSEQNKRQTTCSALFLQHHLPTPTPEQSAADVDANSNIFTVYLIRTVTTSDLILPKTLDQEKNLANDPLINRRTKLQSNQCIQSLPEHISYTPYATQKERTYPLSFLWGENSNIQEAYDVMDSQQKL